MLTYADVASHDGACEPSLLQSLSAAGHADLALPEFHFTHLALPEFHELVAALNV